MKQFNSKSYRNYWSKNQENKQVIKIIFTSTHVVFCSTKLNQLWNLWFVINIDEIFFSVIIWVEMHLRTLKKNYGIISILILVYKLGIVTVLRLERWSFHYLRISKGRFVYQCFKIFIFSILIFSHFYFYIIYINLFSIIYTETFYCHIK